MRIAAFLALGMMLIAGRPAQTAETIYPFPQALAKGMAYLAPSHASDENATIIDQLPKLDPGIVEGFGYLWGGPTQHRLDYVAATAAKIHAKLPRVMLSAVWSEGVRANYDELLHCGGAMGDRRFTAGAITAGRPQSKTSVWLDMARPDAALFYECLGQMYLDMGFTMLRFEAPTLVLRNATNRGFAERAYASVMTFLRAYAAQRQQAVVFSGDQDLGRSVHLDAVLVPSRFYHVTLQSALRYQNRIARPGVGVGYSYALSPAIVHDTVAEAGPGTRVFFDVDNWDPNQDDLRRFMELDADNRHFLIQQSVLNARQQGAYFQVPLDHCGGCVARDAVVDPCEVLPNNTTEYNAVRCNDLAVIREALRSGPGATR